MYKKILVPLDGSELAETAILYAELVARNTGSEIDLITVTDFDVPDTVRFESEEYLNNVKVNAETVYSEVLAGLPGECIPDYASKNNIDLIVMTTHGRSGISRWALGSVADKMIASASCPILLVRSKHHHQKPQRKESIDRIMVTLDGSRESELVLPYIADLCASLGSEAVLLQVIPRMYHVIGDLCGPVKVPFSTEELAMLIMDTRDYLSQIRRQLEKHQVIAKCQVRTGDEAEEIARTATELHVDLVAMSTHGRSGIKRWILGSVSDKVLHIGDTPLLLVRASESIKKSLEDTSVNDQSVQSELHAESKIDSNVNLIKQ